MSYIELFPDRFKNWPTVESIANKNEEIARIKVSEWVEEKKSATLLPTFTLMLHYNFVEISVWMFIVRRGAKKNSIDSVAVRSDAIFIPQKKTFISWTHKLQTETKQNTSRLMKENRNLTRYYSHTIHTKYT